MALLERPDFTLTPHVGKAGAAVVQIVADSVMEGATPWFWCREWPRHVNGWTSRDQRGVAPNALTSKQIVRSRHIFPKVMTS
ncbi:hypothetical protein [Celeribacter sp.]|uniref:hypothetical protein n=1 Tax=Celeribacter sp. TaxID=1890673 RepID=UPI003A93DB35